MPATNVARLPPGGTIILADRVDAAIRTERAYCTTCGWVLPAGARPTCAACGGDSTPLPLVDNTRPIAREDEDDAAALASAREAWATGEHARAMGLALALTAAPRAFASPYGQGWVAVVGSTPVFAFLDPASSQVTLEIPVVRLPQAKRVPALRAALALCNEGRVASRFCLRLDLLVARFVARLDALSPVLVRKIAREIAATARRAEEHLAAAFDARPAIPEQGLLSAWDRVGRSLPLTLLAPSSVAAPPPSSPSSMRPSSRPSGRPSAPAPLLDTPAKAITLRLSIPPVLAPDLDEDDLPAVLAPDYADVPPPSPATARPPSMPPPSRPSFDDTPSMRPSMLPSALPNVPVLGLRTPFPSTSAMRAVPPPGSDADAPPPSRRPQRAPPDTMSPEGKLCELLRQGLGLATALSFEERPLTMLLLVRAAVFRAVHEHYAAVPNAVAYLYRATRTVTREVWSSKPDPGRAGAIPVAEPALGALEQILAARASIPKEKPVTIDPWTSAQQAKENLSKYIAEIELAPPDPTLRHYLALGALSELLARTRLPAPTDQRLRDIVAYAQRDGAKPHVIELMMTALRKIVAG